MLRLSEEPKRLTSTFLTYRNDIDVYTEDEDKDKEFYKVLFGRLIKNDIKINDITPLGSRAAVKKRCIEEPNNGRKKIFIIDGDVNIIHGDNVPNLQNLYVLDAYCIENFLFDKQSIINFIYLNCATKSKELIDSELDFENWLNSYSKKLIDLFIHFALVDYFGGLFTLFNVHKYHQKKGDDLYFKDEIIDQDIQALREIVLTKTTMELMSAKHDELKSKWSTCIESLLTIVSGKDYLIPILLIKTQRFKKSKALPSLEEVKLNLVQNCSLARLNPLKEKMESL